MLGKMKTKIFVLISLLILLSGCGITRGSYNPETKELRFWMGKEYDSFTLIYKNGDEEFYIHAKNVDAFEGQKLIKEGFIDAVKAGVKATIPAP